MANCCVLIGTMGTYWTLSYFHLHVLHIVEIRQLLGLGSLQAWKSTTYYLQDTIMHVMDVG